MTGKYYNKFLIFRYQAKKIDTDHFLKTAHFPYLPETDEPEFEEEEEEE